MECSKSFYLCSQSMEWTQYDNKLFENSLTEFDLEAPDLFEKIASRVPRKTIEQIAKHYQSLIDDIASIESDSFPVPEYADDLNLNENSEERVSNQSVAHKCSNESSRKRGIPWTEEEHRLFLLGMKKHGKGDWRGIARNYVITRTPAQVASHAQKYFIRLNNPRIAKERRRSSILDIQNVSPTAKPMISESTKYKPAVPSSLPHPAIADPPHVSCFPMAGSSHNRFGSSTMPETRIVTTPSPSFSQPALYGYNEECMNYPSNAPSNAHPSNNLISNPLHFPWNSHSS